MTAEKLETNEAPQMRNLDWRAADLLPRNPVHRTETGGQDIEE